MGKWLDLAREMDQCRALSAVSAQSPPNCTKSTNCTGVLPPVVVMGLRRLGAMPPPRSVRPDVWRGVVSDALMLRDDGWAATALGLGWSTLDLWGASKSGDESLSIWLRGRRLTLLDGATAIATDGEQRFQFTRRSTAGWRLLWEA